MDMISEWVDASPDRSRVLAEEELIVDVSEEIWIALKKIGISKAELANRLGVSKPRVSKLLDGSSNLTLRVLADIAFELGQKVSVSITERRNVLWTPTERTSSVLLFTPDFSSPCMGKAAFTQTWNDINDNRFENATESIAA